MPRGAEPLPERVIFWSVGLFATVFAFTLLVAGPS